MNKVVKFGLVALISMSLLTGCGCSKQNKDNETNNTPAEEEKFNTNEGVIEDKELNGLNFTNTSLEVKDNASTLVTSVTNPTSSAIEVRVFDIIVKDKDGNVMTTLQGYVGGEIPAGQTRKITSNVDMNLTDAVTIEYKLIK